MKHIIAIDLGGTSCRAALLDAHGNVMLCNVLETLPNATHLAQQLQSIIERIRQQHRSSEVEIAVVCIGFPGVVDPQTYAIRQAPNISGIDAVDLRRQLSQSAGVPVLLENDTNLGAIAEWSIRSETAHTGLVFMALGTGFGGGLIFHGALWRGHSGGAGEICNMGLSGHSQRVLHQLGCDAGTWTTEDLVSGRGISELYRLLCAAEPSDLPGILADWLHPPVAANHRHVPEIFAAAQANERVACHCVDIVARELAHAIGQIHHLINPELYVLAGGIGTRPEFIQAVNAQLIPLGITVEGSRFRGGGGQGLRDLPTASLAGAAIQCLAYLNAASP